MTISNENLINELLAQTNICIKTVKHFQQLSLEELKLKPSPESWCILECIIHLNMYSDYYLPVLEEKISSNHSLHNQIFKSGILGNYFANLMTVNNGKITKMKAPKDKTPTFADITSKQPLNQFIDNQERFKKILMSAQLVDLTKIKIPISLTRLIKLRLGDTLRFVSYHNVRHIHQAEIILL